MNYAEAVGYLDGFVNFERKSLTRDARAAITLDRVRELAARLDNPQDRFASLHVAGTKGKGSTCAMIEAALRASGRRTGLFTSPHLAEPTERIRIAGDPLDAGAFAALFDRVHAANLLCRLPEPKLLLGRLPSLVNPGGELVLATPCTWLEEFTPPQHWPTSDTFSWLAFFANGHASHGQYLLGKE